MTNTEFDDLVARAATKVCVEMRPVIEEAALRARLPVYLTTAGVLRETGLKRRSQQRLRDSGRISFRKIGGVVICNTSELLAELERLKIPAIPHNNEKT